jgi:pyrroloquinoline quinone biosynthesis protein B
VSEARRLELTPGEASVGLLIKSDSGKRLAYLPAAPQITDALLEEMESTDVLLFDGTFWRDDELIRIQGSGQTALQMGHVPVSCSLAHSARCKRPRKIYIHINNTNPMLDESGREYRQVREAGWEVAEDGWQFEL